MIAQGIMNLWGYWMADKINVKIFSSWDIGKGFEAAIEGVRKGELKIKTIWNIRSFLDNFLSVLTSVSRFRSALNMPTTECAFVSLEELWNLKVRKFQCAMKSRQ
jgi:hypothetical protein